MLVWGKLAANPGVEPDQKEEKVFYSTNVGQIVSNDGSGYVIPKLAELASDKTEFIPLELAQKFVKAAAKETADTKEIFKQQQEKAQQKYKQSMKDVVDHYEAIVKDMKQKALRHVEIQKQMKAMSEEALKKEIKANEDTIDEMRDSMATLNREYQEEVRGLKNRVSAFEELVKQYTANIQELTITSECNKVMEQLKAQVIDTKTSTELQSMNSKNVALTSEMKKVKEDLRREHDLLRDELITGSQEDAYNRRECSAVLSSILQEIEQQDISEYRQYGLLLLNRLNASMAKAKKDAEDHRSKYNAMCSSMKTQLAAYVQQVNDLQLQNQRLIERATVELTLNNAVWTVSESHAKQSSLNAQSAKNQKLLTSHQDAMASMSKEQSNIETKYKKQLNKLQDQSIRYQVELCLSAVVSKIVERNTIPATGGTGGKGTVVVPVMDFKDTSNNSSAAQIERLQDRIRTLEKALAEKDSKLSSAADAKDAKDVSNGNTPRRGLARAGSVSSNSELTALRLEERQLTDQLAALEASIAALKMEIDQLNQEKEINKNEIKAWTKEFIDTHDGKEPDNTDKVAIKDKYQNYKAISTHSKELDGKFSGLNKEQGVVQQKLAEVKQKILSVHQNSIPVTPPAGEAPVNAFSASATVGVAAAGMVMKPKVETADCETQTAGSTLMSQASVKNGLQQSGGEADISVVEQLEDEVYNQKQANDALVVEREALKAEMELLKHQLDAFIKEKRTDVVKRFEDEISQLQTQQSELNETIALIKAEKTKSDTKIEELKGRAETAEAELRERDRIEQQALNPNEEKFALKGQINKQRDAIILKSKAATAGWDAAANADEKLDVEVQKAYKKGMNEEKEKHKGDMAALNAAIEEKEVRITELLVNIGEMERKVFKSDAEVAEMKNTVEAMKLEINDVVANLTSIRGGSGGGDGEDVALGPSQAELDNAREELDAAQDELVMYMDKCEKLEQELEISRKKNRIYDRLAATSGIMTGNAGGGDSNSQPAAKSKGVSFANEPKYDFNELVLNVKKAILKGTNLWKSNRKDDCYDVYLESCQETANRLITAELKDQLNDAVTNGKSFGGQNKQRGSVVLRKALDKFLADAVNPALKKAEEDAAAAIVEKKHQVVETQRVQNNSAMEELRHELEELENSFLEQGYTKDNNPSNALPEGSQSPRNKEGSASLLHRAKAAEDMVKSLKGQLAMVIAATANRTEPAATADSGAASAAAGKRPVVKDDQPEIRKLNRKIKELEAQLKNNTGGGAGGSGGGGNAAADSKAAILAEKQAQKKLKDMEAANKKETKALEMRAVKAENALAKIQNTYNTIVAERDQLKAENDKLFGLSNELNVLRTKAEKCIELENELNAKVAELAIVNEAFKKETTLRKKYKNELEDLKGAIRVYARCRPMAKYEIEKGCKSVVECKDETSLKVTTTRGEKDFEFDAVFSPTSTQDAVFEDTKRLVESCLDGFNVCLFAYGQTGSGKTFTMTGSPSMPGLTPKAIDELYRLIAERKHLQVKVTTYFVELYNDNLVDLYWVLDNKRISNAEPPKLDIKMDAKKMVFIRNSVIKDANSPEELMDLFNKGNLERHTGATKMNAESSRSHSIFAIMVESYDTTSKRTTMGKLSLVDLAGSERADKTGASAERLKEAQNINKSLSALGDVIAALSEGEKFIPYRNNKLTQLMQDSLGGNAKTLMFVNFSPADYNADETSTSLMYAARVKKIVNNASKQADSAEVAKLKHIIKRLKEGASLAEIENVDEVAADEGPPPPADDGKIYDGY